MLHPSRVGCRVLKLSLLTRLGEHCRYVLIGALDGKETASTQEDPSRIG